jgi:hypothetical protein
MAMTDADWRDRLGQVQSALPKCSHDELEAIALVVERVGQGRRQYGPLEMATDNRDWATEALEEAVDGLFYQAILLINIRRVLGRGP